MSVRDRLCDCSLPSPSIYDGSVCETCNGRTALAAKARLTSCRSGLLPTLDSQYDSVSIAKVYAFALPKPSRRKKDSWASECPSLRPSTSELHSRSYSNLSAFQGFGSKGTMNRTEGGAGGRSPLFRIAEYQRLLTMKQVEEDEQDEDVKPRKPHDSTIHLCPSLDSKGSSRASTTLSHSHETSQSPSFSALTDALKKQHPARLVRSAAQTRSNSASGFYNDGKLIYCGASQHRNAVNAVIANEDWTISGSSDYRVNIWRTRLFPRSDPLVSSSICHKRPIHSLCWLDTLTFCSGGSDSLIKVTITQIWRIDDSRPTIVSTFKSIKSPIQRLLSPSPKLLIAGSSSGALHICDIETHSLISSEETEHSRCVTGLVQQSPSSFLSSSLDGTVKLWDLRNKRSIASFEGHSSAISCIQIWDEYSFLSAGGDWTMRKWDFRTCAALQTWETTEEVNAICRLRGFIVTAGTSIRVWGTDTNLTSLKGSIRCMTVMPETDWLAAGSCDSSLSVWRL